MPTHRPTESHDNVITSRPAQQGNSRAYTLDRLSRDAPELYEAVKRKELSPYAAAIEAGIRKRPQPLDQIRKLLPKLTVAERRQLKEML